MKYKLLKLLFAGLLLGSFPLAAESCCDNASEQCCNSCCGLGGSTIEIRAGGFYHTSSLFREIYGKCSPCYEVEAATTIYDNWQGWANFDWFSKRGRSDGFGDHTRVSIANFSLGIKKPFPITDCALFYLGIGPSFSTIRIKNKCECCEHSKQTKFVWGGVVKSGINYFFTDCMFVDLFVDYLYQPVHFEKTVDIGGFKFGVGIGTKF